MQIPPSSSLLQALSGSGTNSTTALNRKPGAAQTAAAREAARAVFAQLKTPAVGNAGTPAPSLPATAAPPTVPTTQPRRPLPRGSIINILV